MLLAAYENSEALYQALLSQRRKSFLGIPYGPKTSGLEFFKVVDIKRNSLYQPHFHYKPDTVIEADLYEDDMLWVDRREHLTPTARWPVTHGLHVYRTMERALISRDAMGGRSWEGSMILCYRGYAEDLIAAGEDNHAVFKRLYPVE